MSKVPILSLYLVAVGLSVGSNNGHPDVELVEAVRPGGIATGGTGEFAVARKRSRTVTTVATGGTVVVRVASVPDNLGDRPSRHAVGDDLDQARPNGVFANVPIPALFAVRTGTRAGLEVDLVGTTGLAVDLVEAIGDPLDGHSLGDRPREAATLDGGGPSRWSKYRYCYPFR